MSDYVWFWRKRFPERKGQRCKVLVRGKMNSCLVEFEDGFRVITSRFAVRREKKCEGFGPLNGEVRLRNGNQCR